MVVHEDHTSPRQTHIGVGLGEDLHVKQIQYLRVVQGKDALQDEDMRRVDARRLLGPLMLFERIMGDLSPLPSASSV